MSDDVAKPMIEPVPIARITTHPMRISFTPGSALRAALGDRFALVELSSLTADLTVRRRRDTGWIELKGTLDARVVQECVVSLEPVESEIHCEIDELFDDDRPVDGTEIDLDPIGDDPEPLEGEHLDVGEVVAQALYLSIDPYPRSAGVSTDLAGGEGSGDVSAFAELALLKDRGVKNR